MRADLVARGVGLGALALIAGALGFQYIGGIAPCEMCHWQRWPHIAAAVIGLVMIAFVRDKARALAWIAIALVLASGLIGLYQSGMQWGILPGPSSCSGHRFVIGSNMVPEVQCDVVSWQLFGLSLATYNAIFSFLIAGLGGFALLKAKNAP
ncbi:MAG TPA: disulfide bond formation protein B [Rhizomicrobium sp.]|nr:disulfide bond formation protein B [Rhizomicrobium sp.]